MDIVVRADIVPLRHLPARGTWLWRSAVAVVVLASGCTTLVQGPATPTRALPDTWPTPPSYRTVTSGYGYRKDPYTGKTRHHNGLDIAAPLKSPVMATADGIVVYSGWNRGGYGNLVKIDHGNGCQTWYAHLSYRSVRAGDRVARGTIIGGVGKTGRATGYHVHYEVRWNGSPVDPSPYLGNRQLAAQAAPPR